MWFCHVQRLPDHSFWTAIWTKLLPKYLDHFLFGYSPYATYTKKEKKEIYE